MNPEDEQPEVDESAQNEPDDNVNSDDEEWTERRTYARVSDWFDKLHQDKRLT